MPKMKVLSGMDTVRFFEQNGFVIIAQKGSHIQMKRKTQYGNQSITIPNHKTLRKGTQRFIITLAIKYSLEQESRDFFYTK